MKKRRLTPGYIFFYILFSPDAWRVLIGLIASYLVTPLIAPPAMKQGAVMLLYIMMATIGYAVSALPSRGIARVLKKLILGDKLPR